MVNKISLFYIFRRQHNFNKNISPNLERKAVDCIVYDFCLSINTIKYVVKGCPTYAEERKSYIYLHPLQVRANCSLTPDCWFIQFVDIFSINWHKCWVSGQQENTKICCIIPNKVTTFNCLLDQFKSMLQSFVWHDNPIVCSFIPNNITLQLVVMCSTNWCQNYLFLANKPIGIRFQ